MGVFKKVLLTAAAAGVLIKSPVTYDLLEQYCMLPVARVLPPEVAHRAALWAVKLRIPPKDNYNPLILSSSVMGLWFENPIGLAAGFDKDCEAVAGLTRLGFGFVELGSVTPLPQDGNERPRLFRLPADKALVNRFGFPSKGADAAAENLETQLFGFKLINMTFNRKEDEDAAVDDGYSTLSLTIRNRFLIRFLENLAPKVNLTRVGINIGINKGAKRPARDYLICIDKLADYSDYLVINVSSPNTPGLRDLQRGANLHQLMKRVSAKLATRQNWRECPLLLKISPDLTEEGLEEVLEVVQDPRYKISGLVVSNTTTTRPEALRSASSTEKGGLSGEPLKDLSTEMIKKVYIRTRGQVPIIGVGGVSTAQDAYQKMRAGASLVQLYTGLVYNGFGSVRRMKRELVHLIKEDGYNYVDNCIGADVWDQITEVHSEESVGEDTQSAADEYTESVGEDTESVGEVTESVGEVTESEAGEYTESAHAGEDTQSAGEDS